jgi:LuxR family maltose regulon positive regulatory protein
LQESRHCRLTTVVAPAGWGKSTLLALWARGQQAAKQRVAWVSLDDADDEPVRFWTYTLSALDAVAPEVAGEALAALKGPGLDPMDVALPVLLNALTSAEHRCVLILDDYHVLTNRRIHEGVEFLLAYLPDSLQLVLASRADPPLPLARMRARADLVEIRVDDLRWTSAEGSALVATIRGDRALSADTSAALVERTEGWPAGLHLAALAVRVTQDPASVAAEIRGDDRHILDYFAAEVLPVLDAEQRDLLVRCSVLERLSGPLCDAVLETTGSDRVLERLDRSDLFVTALGGGWYRCHRLFRDVLRRELDKESAEAPSSQLINAAGWFLEQEQVEEAVEYRLAGGDDAGALELVLSRGRWFMDHGATAALLRMGERLASSVSEPRLFVSLAWAAGLSGHAHRCSTWLEAAEPLIDPASGPLDGWRSLRAGADTVRAVYVVPGDSEDALRYSRRATELENDDQLWGYIVARQALGGALLGAGSIREALDVLWDCWHTPVRHELPSLFLLQAAGQLGIVLVELGDLEGAREVFREVSDVAAAAEQAWGEGVAGAIALLRLAEARLAMVSDARAAIPALRRALQLAEGWGRATVIVASLTSLASAQWTAGDRAGARASLDQAAEAAEVGEARPLAVRQLNELEARIGRGAVRTARVVGMLAEELTDREMAVLRALRGPLTAREIASELYLSINTVKGYTKSLYRKLAVDTRAQAVQRGHELGLI